ncbi:MAG: hypothetical protein EOP06_10365, partial [Proteobacteria bacterium]
MKYVLGLIALSGVVACNSGSSSPGKSQEIPETLQPRAISTKPALTDSQKTELRKMMDTFSNMPNSTLLLPPNNEDSSSRYERERGIQELSATGRQNYDRIKQNCQFNNPDATVIGDSGGDKAGDVRTTKKTATIQGDRCPINLGDVDESTMVMLENNQQEIQD